MADSVLSVCKQSTSAAPACAHGRRHRQTFGACETGGRRAAIGSNRLAFGDCDVLTSKLRPYLGKTIQNTYPDGIGTTEWVPLKVDPKQFSPRLLGYLLQSQHYVAMSSAFMAGKEHPRINPEDILTLQVPLPPMPEQGLLTKALDGMSAKCKSLEETIGSELNLVDRYFETKFASGNSAINAP